MKKSPLTSKTLWFNGLSLAAAIITVLVDHQLILQYPAVVAGLTMAASAVNMVLRYFTTKPVVEPK